jgi:hypothetical protein
MCCGCRREDKDDECIIDHNGVFHTKAGEVVAEVDSALFTSKGGDSMDWTLRHHDCPLLLALGPNQSASCAECAQFVRQRVSTQFILWSKRGTDAKHDPSSKYHHSHIYTTRWLAC